MALKQIIIVFIAAATIRKLNKDAKNHRLSSLCEQFDINLKNHHRALDDTLALFTSFSRGLRKIS